MKISSTISLTFIFFFWSIKARSNDAKATEPIAVFTAVLSIFIRLIADGLIDFLRLFSFYKFNVFRSWWFVNICYCKIGTKRWTVSVKQTQSSKRLRCHDLKLHSLQNLWLYIISSFRLLWLKTFLIDLVRTGTYSTI